MDIATACTEFLAHCRVAKKLSHHTLRAYTSDLMEFRGFAGAARPVGSVDRTLLRGYLAHLFERRGLKEASVKRRIACLKAMYRWLELEETVAISPFHRMDLRIRLPRRLPRNLGREELRRLLAAPAKRLGLPPGRYDPKRVERATGLDPERIGWLSCLVALELLAATGVRVGELAAVRLADLDLDDGSIRVLGKGNRQRLVFLPNPEVVKLLRAWLTVRLKLSPRDAALLVTPRGYAATTQTIRAAVAAAGRDAALDRPVTPHMLRHTAATNLLEAGVDIRFVQRLLGHQSISTTEIYTAVSDESLREAVRRGQR